MATPGGTPMAAGTPAPAASPALEASPVSAAGLRVTLAARSNQAGPVTLIVTVTDPVCGPVSGATVTIATHSVDMNMGTETSRAIEQAPGRYVAKDVPMGMGGRWQAAVKVERPGLPPVTADFLLTLKGPM